MKNNRKKFSAMLIAPDIIECRKNHQGILIAPFNDQKAKGIGYNISPSNLVYSIKKGVPQKIFDSEEGSYTYINPNDTVLILSYEYIQTDSKIAGTFHSRVRNSAKGLGNVSTTLDPGWKGMLLIAINNPTKKKIKLPITVKKDGKVERCSLITLVVFQNDFSKKENHRISFHLDNPPMRADIWSELTAMPRKLLHNDKYQKFQRFINQLISFKPSDSSEMCKYKTILELILKLEIALYSEKSEILFRTCMLELNQRISMDDEELREKYTSLQKLIDDCYNRYNSFNQIISVQRIKEKIDLIRDECKYLILCNEVEQIHEFITKNIEVWWEHATLSQFFDRYILPNLSAIIISVALCIMLLFGVNIEQNGFLAKLIVSLSPILLSVLINIFTIRKNRI